jgi:hypothetical protein
MVNITYYENFNWATVSLEVKIWDSFDSLSKILLCDEQWPIRIEYLKSLLMSTIPQERLDRRMKLNWVSGREIEATHIDISDVEMLEANID